MIENCRNLVWCEKKQLGRGACSEIKEFAWRQRHALADGESGV